MFIFNVLVCVILILNIFIWYLLKDIEIYKNGEILNNSTSFIYKYLYLCVKYYYINMLILLLFIWII